MPGIIYVLSNIVGRKVYVGSTDRGDNTQVYQRLAEHTYSWNNPARPRCSSAEVFDEGKVVSTIVEYVNGGKLDTRVREQFWIDDLKTRGFTVVNKVKPINRLMYEFLLPIVNEGFVVNENEKLAGGHLPA